MITTLSFRRTAFGFYSITLLLTFFISSCSTKPDNVLKEDTFVTVLSELMIIERLTIPYDQKVYLTQTVLDTNRVSIEQFNTTRRYYQSDPDYWIKIYKKAAERIREKQDRYRPDH